MDIQAAVQKIIERTQSMKPGAASIFLAENVRHHQNLCKQIAARMAKPAGWNLAAHEELIHALISAENALRNERVAA
ncbi:hypothetical protein LJR235_002921 [Pararhizobium sp. LjRoot235]|uniref:hypothetical protein n=1 Tax=Pararhizobium sp. LjRoot235 TaxID=3342291 RepID=UPI003ED0499D